MIKYIYQRIIAKKPDREGIDHLTRRLSMIYAFFAWNCFGFAFYFTMKDRVPTDREERRESYKTLTGVPGNLNVYRVEGITIKDELDKLREVQRKKWEEKQQETVIKVDNH